MKIPNKYPLAVIKAVWRKINKPSKATIEKIKKMQTRRTMGTGLVAIGTLMGMVALMGQEQVKPTKEQQETQVIVEDDPNSLPLEPNLYRATVITTYRLDLVGGGLGLLIYNCPPGHTPLTGGCMVQPPGTPVPGCLTSNTTFSITYDNIVCDGRPHLFPVQEIWMVGSDGVPHHIANADWSPIWNGAQPWTCLPDPVFNVRTRDIARYPGCTPTPPPRGTPTPTPTATPTPSPTPGPSPTPIVCSPGYHYCAPQWYCSPDPACGCYWTRPNCCPTGYECRITFLWFTCYNMSCCNAQGCLGADGVFKSYEQMALEGYTILGDDGKPLN